MNRFSVKVLAACCFFMLAAVCWATEEKPTARGMTMRIEQDMLLGDLSATADYRASFLPPDKFRVEGAMRLKAMEMRLGMTIVGDGPLVKQIAETPAGPKAYTLNLDRVRKAIPGYEYTPSKTYDPSLYSDMVKAAAQKKELPPEELDGATTEGHELPLAEGRLSLPSNSPLVMPEPAKARVWLNPKDGIARKVELVDAQGNTFLRTLYTEVKTQVAIKPEVFDLQWPQGAAPTDITEIVLQGVQDARRAPKPAAEPKPTQK